VKRVGAGKGLPFKPTAVRRGGWKKSIKTGKVRVKCRGDAASLGEGVEGGREDSVIGGKGMGGLHWP